jgi:hypothetical protein
VLVEKLHHAGEVQKGPAQTVHLVDHHAVDAARLDAGEEPLEGGPLHVAAGEAAVVEPIRNAHPSLVSLARDIGFRGFPLGVEAVELLLQPLVCGLAGVDGAADRPVGS